MIKHKLLAALALALPSLAAAFAAAANVTDLTLASGFNSSSGRVLVRLNGGPWGTVCDTGFNDNAARAVCRGLGYAGGIAKGTAYFGEGSGPILLDAINCTGTETSFAKCSFDTSTQACSHGEDAGVICSAGEEGRCLSCSGAGVPVPASAGSGSAQLTPPLRRHHCPHGSGKPQPQPSFLCIARHGGCPCLRQ